MKRFAVLLSLSVQLTLLAGCASIRPPAPPPAPLTDADFAPPSEPVGTDHLFTLSPEMQDYLHSPTFKALLREHGPRFGLVEALYRKTDLQIEYESTTTRSAAQTYAARSGNCLSLVIMTAAFAKALGMPVRYQNIEADSIWSREGELFVASSHVNITLGEPRRPNVATLDETSTLLVDFLPRNEAARLRTRPLQETDILALFMNNRAAEMLIQGRLDDAYWWARGAVGKRPQSIVALNTLGVIYQRRGKQALAEQTFRAALAREPDNIAAMRNLHPVLLSLGKTDAARELAQRIARFDPVPPYRYFDEGMLALQAGNTEQATALFEREVKRSPFNDEFHFWLGVSYARMGQMRRAHDELAKAIEHSTRRDARDRYSAKLNHLKKISMDKAPMVTGTARIEADDSRFH